jgi:hypothetical protein
MPAPFAALEARLNGAVEQRLTNVQAVFGGGEPFGAIFTREVGDAFGGVVDAPRLTLGFLRSRAPALVNGSEILVDGVAHVVDSPVQPDASGWLTINVYPKAGG